MDIKEIKDRIWVEGFNCINVSCEHCPFLSDLESLRCGGGNESFDFKAIKVSKVKTLKGLLKYKCKDNINKYPKLK